MTSASATPRRPGSGVSRITSFLGFAALLVGYAVGSRLVGAARGFVGNPMLEFLSGASYLGAGLYAIYRKPANLVGRLLLAYGVLWFLPYWATLFPYYLEAAVEVLGLSMGAILVHIALVFPDGRAATRFARAVIVAIYTWNLSSSFAAEATVDRTEWARQGYAPDRTEWARQGYDCSVQSCRATLSFWPSAPINQGIWRAQLVMTALFVVLTVLAFGQRWRLSSPVQRRDLRPLWLPIALVGSGYAADSIASWSGAGDPFLRSILESRILAQTVAPFVIVWGLINARMAAAVVGDVMRDIRRPLRPDDLENALAQALRDPSTRLLSPTAEGGWVDRTGAEVSLPDDNHRIALIGGDNEQPRAALVHDPGIEPGAAEAAAAVAGLALENAALHDAVVQQLAEVEASRARIVAAGYAERKRVERDLHDGAQQRLLALAMALRLAQRQADGNPELATTLREANDELAAAIDELRELARGIHPAILTDAGLGPAVRVLLDRSHVARGDLVLPDERFPPAVESTAYFVIAEGLANAAKHAPEARISISVAVHDGALLVQVSDDGAGSADAGQGSGLRGLADRVAAAGGTFDVASPAGDGTTIRAQIPLDVRR